AVEKAIQIDWLARQLCLGQVAINGALRQRALSRDLIDRFAGREPAQCIQDGIRQWGAFGWLGKGVVREDLAWIGLEERSDFGEERRSKLAQFGLAHSADAGELVVVGGVLARHLPQCD